MLKCAKVNTKSKSKNSFLPWILLFFLVFQTHYLAAQQIEVSCNEKPLNELLVELRDEYQQRFSFDDSALSNYKITIQKKFSSFDEALDYILTGLPYKFEKYNEVFLIYPVVVERSEKSKFILAGQFLDSKTKESLPFTHLLVNDMGIITDEKGRFQQVSEDSVFYLQASYLGYYLLDTIVAPNVSCQFLLKPFNIKLKEVRVEADEIVRNLQIGKTPGGMRLNHNIASYLPGNGDNSIFNLLRLQPGILAAGEQSNDLIIWGSYEGQSKLMFDGFTLFGMKNFNDNISAVNPFMAKDIQVYKGGYGAEHGERVGGLVNIVGIEGDHHKPRVNLNLNNMTLNGMFSLPIKQKASLSLAFRQTYYELYDTGVLTFGRQRNTQNTDGVDVYTYPDYNFQDINLKFSGRGENGDSYSVSFLGAGDRFKSSTELENNAGRVIALDEQKERNTQNGGSIFYGKKWANGSTSNFTVSFSGIETTVDRFREVYRWRRTKNGQFELRSEVRIDQLSANRVAEANVKVDNLVALDEIQQLKFGVNYIYDQVDLSEDSADVNHYDEMLSGARVSGYLEDAISLAKNFQVKLGLRGDYATNLSQLFVQPRIATEVKFSDHAKISGAWGLYRQYLVRSSVVDSLDNYRYFWTISDNNDIPVQESYHTVAGFHFNKNDFTFSIEGYYKQSEGITRYVNPQRYRDVYIGESKSRGLDFFIKKDWKGHSAWVSYSLSETLERFPTFPIRRFQEYNRALHDQRHELKLATLLNLRPFFFSANYVYGSGFPDQRLERDTGIYEFPYNRFDVSLVYQIIAKKSLLEVGVSILNVFNHENIKYANFIRVPYEQEVSVNYHAEAVPSTPTMFINFSF